uniref:NADH-ubiquinone oxidoreductase chain 1 n=1 Tax=Hycleus phaleratus TaxID=1248972 RepID=A0A343A7E9_9CUCU|nr:NADH dehydrogenase subunit 1 [Hycleus phaleratus]APB02803.1 NADH dehydrogenase subunit 1 [Hycleus phaleratus]ATP06067.1 NADH dehydrogenase subunit 1 [Hycleus phaleratus]
MYFLDLVGVYISMLFLVVCVLMGVAYLTLLERKVLGYIQIRKGPNKVGFWGILQPFSDAIKLFTKEQTFPYMANLNIYYFSPAVNLFISLLLWMCMPFFTVYLNFSMSILFFLAVSSLSVYTLMLAGWSSNSGYSLLGSLRAVAQTISYEVSLALIFMSFIYLILSMNVLDFVKVQKFIWLLFLMFPLSLMWIISGLAETNRTPFDFAEGESELVSGFNIEYSSGGFALIFLAEYSSILFMSMLCILIFMGGDIYSGWFFLKLTFLSFFWIWARGTLPRFRYDKLMYLAWKSFLPSSLMYMIFFFSFKVMLLSLFL